MAEERKKKKSDVRVDSVDEIVSEHTSVNKKKKNRENKDSVAGSERVKLGEDAVVRKKPKKLTIDSGTDVVNRKIKKSKKKIRVGSEADDDDDGNKEESPGGDVVGNSESYQRDENSLDDAKLQQNVDSEADDDRNKGESADDVIGNSERDEKLLDDAKRKTGKRKRSDSDLGAQESLDTEMKSKSRKKKKQSEDSEAEANGLISTKDAKKKRKKKQSKVSEAEENNNDGKDAKKKRKKGKSGKSDKDVTNPSSKSTKRVKFSDQVDIFPAEDEEEEEEVKLVRGKRFTKEEDELVKKAVLEYIDNHALGEEGLNMVMDCQSHPQVKGCWKEIESALPWRARYSVYHRAHNLFEEGSKGVWTKEDLELVKQFQAKHGNDWKTLADAMGKHRVHVKDAWRRIRLNMNKGHWSREEYQKLFDLVNKDLRMKAFHEKHSKHGMLRDNIPWMAISDVIGTRDHVTCCNKWYDQLNSPMVAQGIWANADDYRLLDELLKLDAACIDDVDWDDLLENRDGEACRKRWNQMVLHIGIPKSKTFVEQVELLSERYCPDIAEDREDFDNRPYDPED